MTSHRLKAENAAAPSRRTKRKAAAAALTKRLPLDRESLKFLKPPFVAEAFLRLVDSRGKSVGRVDLRVDRGYFGNHMIIRDAPRADNPVRRSRIGSGPRLWIKLGMCGCLSQSALSYRSLTVTFCRKSRPIINGRLFLSISPITGLGLCELSELCERLILSSVWAVLLHKAGGVFTPRPCAL